MSAVHRGTVFDRLYAKRMHQLQRRLFQHRACQRWWMPVVHRRHVRQPAAGHCLQKLRGWDVQYGLLHVNLPTVRERYVRQPAGGHGLPELRGWDVHSVTYNGASLTFRSQPWAIELMIARAPIAAAENATITAENGDVIKAKVFYSFKRTR